MSALGRSLVPIPSRRHRGGRRWGVASTKTRALVRPDLDDFVACYNPASRYERVETERFRAFSYDELEMAPPAVVSPAGFEPAQTAPERYSRDAELRKHTDDHCLGDLRGPLHDALPS